MIVKPFNSEYHNYLIHKVTEAIKHAQSIDIKIEQAVDTDKLELVGQHMVLNITSLAVLPDDAEMLP